MDALSIVTASLPPAMATQAYDVDLQALGGVLPYTWVIVPGFGTPPAGMNLVAGKLVAASGAIAETQVGVHAFRIRVTDSDAPPTVQVMDVSVSVRPYGFTRAYDFLLDPQFFDLVQKYLVAGVTREKVELHFFRDILSSVGTNFQHLDRDILVEDWVGVYPFHAAADEDLRSVLDGMANDLLYFANPLQYAVAAVVPGPMPLQGTFTLASGTGAFIGRNGETDAAAARKWFRLVDPVTDDEPHDGDGNPLTIISVLDAAGVEINPDLRPYQADAAGFHTGRDNGGGFIGYTLTIVVAYVPNPNAKAPIVPFAVRYGERSELHDVDPESFIKFANVVGDMSASTISLIKNAPFTAAIRVDNQLVKPVNQVIEMVGQNGVNIEPDAISGRVRVVAPDSVRTINGVPPAGAGDFEFRAGEFIEIESELTDKQLTIKTVIPIHQNGGMFNIKGLLSGIDYAGFLEVVSKAVTRLHKHAGEDVQIGTPPDGQFQDGFIPLDPTQTLAESLDRLNEALGIAIGSVAAPLDDLEINGIGNIDRSRGILATDPTGISITYEPGAPGGSDVDYCHDYSWQLGGGLPFMVEVAAEFGVVSPGDTITMFLNGLLVETWVMGAMVVAGPSPAMVLSLGLVGMNIITVRTPAPGITLVKLHGVIDPAYPGNLGPPVIPNIPLFLNRGYNTIQFTHLDSGAVTHTSALFKVFLDNSIASPGGIGLPATVYGTCPGRDVWVSGVNHYSGDNELLLGFSANFAYQDFHYNPPYWVQMNTPNGWKASKPMFLADLPGTSGSGAWNDTVAPVAFSTGQPVKDYAVAQFPGAVAYLRVGRPRPGSVGMYTHFGPLVDGAGAAVLHDMGVARSTALLETFEDEKYRLNPYDVRWAGYKYIPQMIRGAYGWDATRTLYQGAAPWGDGGGDAGELQINPHVQHAPGLDEQDSGALTWPLINYTAGAFDPAQPADRDYLNKFAATMVAIFDRPLVFKDVPRNSGTLQIHGITSADIGLSYLGSGGAPVGNVNVEIKFPGSKPGYFSGWMDLAKLATGGFADGDGARVGAFRDFAPANKETYIEIDWTGNGLSTQDSGEMVILRVTYRNTGIRVFRIEEVG